jgi:hypothetical protein
MRQYGHKPVQICVAEEGKLVEAPENMLKSLLEALLGDAHSLTPIYEEQVFVSRSSRDDLVVAHTYDEVTGLLGVEYISPEVRIESYILPTDLHERFMPVMPSLGVMWCIWALSRVEQNELAARELQMVMDIGDSAAHHVVRMFAQLPSYPSREDDVVLGNGESYHVDDIGVTFTYHLHNNHGTLAMQLDQLVEYSNTPRKVEPKVKIRLLAVNDDGNTWEMYDTATNKTLMTTGDLILANAVRDMVLAAE